MRKGVAVQLALFLAIAIVCGVFVARDALGPQSFAKPIRITVRLANAGGLASGSQVTYRGVPAGKVASVRLDGDGVVAEVDLDPGQRVPVSSAARVSADTPIAIQHLDLQPSSDTPPYLADGGSIAATGRPLPTADVRFPAEAKSNLETLLVHAVTLADSINPQDLSTLSDALVTGLAGAAPELQRILDNTSRLAELLDAHSGQLTNLATTLPDLAESSGNLPELASSMRQLADQLRAHDPSIRTLLGTAPETTAALAATLGANQQAVGTLLANLVTTSQVVADRIPALTELLTATPTGLSELASIVHGNVADFYLVAAQGPVCYYGTPRRSPTETSPRAPELDWHCPPGSDLAQRGAENAPRPAAGPAAADNTMLGPRYWYSILLQGVQ